MSLSTTQSGRFRRSGLLVITVAAIVTQPSEIAYSDWVWVSGSNASNQAGVYGTKGVADPANVSGARYAGVSWTGASDNLWLFGGYGYDSTGFSGKLNDLWRSDGTNWTWIGGSDTRNQPGIYGTKGVADPANKPGSRWFGVSWTDSGGKLWLFGGSGYDSAGSQGRLNDLWKFDSPDWTWVSGSKTRDQTGVYGAKGLPDPANVPGARSGSFSWIHMSGLWLFGGDSSSAADYRNDLWRFDGANWTWVSGSNTENQMGVYGTKGVAHPTNMPGARSKGVSWVDSSGNALWLFGGWGFDGAGSEGYLNDLWKFEATNWTWVSGSNTYAQAGVYGTKGVADPANVPGARRSSVSWTDGDANLWLFGGYGFDSTGSHGELNDLWKFDGTNWTWVSGSNTSGQPGVYGTKGFADPANVPGARESSVSWADSSGNLWLFGGYGHDSTGSTGCLNDLWKFQSSCDRWALADGLPDFDGDGATDLLWHRTSTGAYFVTLMTGGVPGPYQYVGGGGDPDIGVMGLGDCDGDGTTDLIWRRTSTNAHFVTLMTGGVPGPYQYVGGGGDPDLEIIGLGDCDGGGTTDLLWRRTSTSAYFVTLMTGGVPGAYQYVGGGGDPDLGIIGLGDCDGSGTTDLLWRRTSTNAHFVTLMTAGVPGAYQYAGGGGDPDLAIIGLGEWSGDGQTDLLWRRTSTNAHFVRLMSTGSPGPYIYVGGGGDPDLEIVGLGDCDGSGTTDLLWQRSSTSANFVALTPAIPGSLQYVGGGGDPDLEILAVGDCDGDGTADLRWRRTSTGANFVTLMTGGVPGPYQYVGGGGDPDLGIVELE